MINYNLFVQRKRFKVVEWIKNNTESSYEDFCDFLKEREVSPPAEGKKYWDKALNHLQQQELKIKETPVELSEVSRVVEEIMSEDSDTQVQKEKEQPKKKSRKTKATKKSTRNESVDNGEQNDS